ncbi:MAG: TIGR00266 family protein [Agitococcus sp.]
MAQFTVTGEVDPFLHVSLAQGEKIYCESNAMVMMEDTLDLKGKMGGFGQALMRSFANGESLFQQHIEAVRGAGDCLLSPVLMGGMQILDVGTSSYCLSDGAFVAAETGVSLVSRMEQLSVQGALMSMFGQAGGFFYSEASGFGKLIVSGMGSLFTLDVEPNKDVIIDNAHVVAWDSRLQHKVSLGTSQGGGLMGRLVNSVTSGEGVVLRFSGKGKVVICSRNKDNFIAWMRSSTAGNG